MIGFVSLGSPEEKTLSVTSVVPGENRSRVEKTSYFGVRTGHEK